MKGTTLPRTAATAPRAAPDAGTAETFDHGAPVVSVDDYAGGIALTHVDVR